MWYTITNGQKIAIKKRFFAPWSKTPDAYVKTYGAQLDRRQIECGNLDVTISNDNKVIHFVGEMENSGLFTREFLDKMEDAGAVDWDTTVKNWSKEFLCTVERDSWRPLKDLQGTTGPPSDRMRRP